MISLRGEVNVGDQQSYMHFNSFYIRLFVIVCGFTSHSAIFQLYIVTGQMSSFQILTCCRAPTPWAARGLYSTVNAVIFAGGGFRKKYWRYLSCRGNFLENIPFSFNNFIWVLYSRGEIFREGNIAKYAKKYPHAIYTFTVLTYNTNFRNHPHTSRWIEFKVNVAWRASSWRKDPDPHPLWLLVGTPRTYYPSSLCDKH